MTGCQSAEDTKAEEALEALGCQVVRDEKAKGKPIIEVKIRAGPGEFTDAGLKEVAGLKSLRILELSSTGVTDAGLKELARFQEPAGTLPQLHAGDGRGCGGFKKSLAQLQYSALIEEKTMTSFLCLSAILFAQFRDPVLSFRTNAEQGREVVAKVPGDIQLPMGRLTQEQGQKVLTLALVDDATKKAGPAMLGKYERNANELIFTPRFPFGAGQTYRADFHHPAQLITLEYKMPPAAAKTPPKIVKVYPTADVLPANHLKFYIYFDRPMRGGKELFDHIVLVDDKGREISDPWLIDEIWDEENNCLILYIHPGRIKWGVEQRLLLGPVLYEKREYSLIIRGAWTDLEGNKIGTDFVKKFRTTAEDRAPHRLEPVEIVHAQGYEPRAVAGYVFQEHRSSQLAAVLERDRSPRQPFRGANLHR